MAQKENCSTGCKRLYQDYQFKALWAESEIKMAKLYSYNQLKNLYGDDDEQVKAIKRHLDGINPNNDLSAASHNNSLEAFRRLE